MDVSNRLELDSWPELGIATHNAGKVREFEMLLAFRGWKVRSIDARSWPEPAETGTTFEENAISKVRAAAASGLDLPLLADDSGFCVRELAGDPGIRSARWAGPDKDFSAAMARVHESWQQGGGRDRSAKFVCALALLRKLNAPPLVVRGEVPGQLVWPPRGALGFGYDPMFIPEGATHTYGEMESSQKLSGLFASHRRRAIDALIGAIQAQ